MTDSVMPLGERLRRIERLTPSIGEGVGKLMDHYGLPRTPDDEVDQALAAESGEPRPRCWSPC